MGIRRFYRSARHALVYKWSSWYVDWDQQTNFLGRFCMGAGTRQLTHSL